MLVLCKISGLFLNKLSGDDEYSLLYRDNLTQPIQILLSQKRKTFFQRLSPVLKSTLNFNYFQKKMTLIAAVCPKLLSPKRVIR